ncbi:hypothetical protein [Methylobacter sp.]|uniref:hypothetical protein n=1 Tax=Methylobacter sp. TaxID=2051955 RepID=UPI0024872978|nr:hypothetical protein [Methylobacter sp.]MDI1275971.1 hypothetical protein [Methylobacter sp.]MDI1356713.1 hypothetical protein [Methylobacter sp.]
MSEKKRAMAKMAGDNLKEAKTVAELTQLKDKLALDRVSLIEDAEHSMPASLFSNRAYLKLVSGFLGAALMLHARFSLTALVLN